MRKMKFLPALMAAGLIGGTAFAAMAPPGEDPGRSRTGGGTAGEATPPVAFGGGSNCCIANGGIGCDDAGCQATVCGVDPFCCDVAWDQICADEAADLCGDLCSGGGGGSNCCIPNGGIGCDDPSCQATVCAVDPFCCDVAWDGICADEAADLCGDLCSGGPPPPGSNCCIANGGIGCDNADCQATVCGVDPFCCDVAWDQICADEAADLCPRLCGGGPPPGSNCCIPNGGIGCDNADCQATVCGVDPFCCDVAWDQICADEAADLCGDLCGGGPPPGGDCCTPNGGVGCNDAACQATVCAVDPFCCDVEWDQICADEAAAMCRICGGGGSNCCFANGGVGCDDAECQATVCAVDPFCCDVAWDGICADEASTMCEVCTGGPPPTSADLCNDAINIRLSPGGSVDVDGSTIGATIDSEAGFCDTSITAPGVWYTVTGTGNTITASTCNQASYDTKISVYCGDCPRGQGSNCCVPNGGLGCDDARCQATVCAVDPFCCDVAWDGICADEAIQLCGPTCQTEGGLNCIVGLDDTPGCSNFSTIVSWCSQPGVVYRILVHGFGSATGNFTLTVSDNGTACGGAVQCIETGACCICDGSERNCFIASEADCALEGGIYLGNGSSCLQGDTLELTANPGAGIPDASPAGVSSTINVGKSFSVQDVDVVLDITHTFVGDLCVTLSHGGTTIHLVDRMGANTGGICHSESPFGCGNDNIAGAQLDDRGAGGPIEAQCVPNLTSRPNYTPNQALSAFDGMDAAGDWTLTVSDNAGLDLGTFNSWSLVFFTQGEGSPCDDVLNCGPGTEGCSHGFWKNHPELWENYSPDDLWVDVFGCDAFPGLTLHDVISQPSGPPAPGSPPQLRNLGKQAVAALLNADSLDYGMTPAQVIAATCDAIAAWQNDGNLQHLTDQQEIFGEANNLGCPEFIEMDFNQNGTIGVPELLRVIERWGNSKDDADHNNDGVVNTSDLMMVINNWGVVPVVWDPY